MVDLGLIYLSAIKGIICEHIEKSMNSKIQQEQELEDTIIEQLQILKNKIISMAHI
jgi:hypothetical protein